MLDAEAGDLPRPVRDQLLREADGNPLALHELPVAHRSGRAPIYPLAPPDAGRGGVAPTHSPVEREFAARIAALPASARTALLVAAADGTCDTRVVLAATERLGAGPADLEVLERARLLMFLDGCMGFHHPLIRTAVYGAATLGGQAGGTPGAGRGARRAARGRPAQLASGGVERRAGRGGGRRPRAERVARPRAREP